MLPHCLAYFASLVRPVSVIYICILVFWQCFFNFHGQSFLYANFVNLFSFSFLYAFLSIEISLHNFFFVTYIVKFGCTSGKCSHSACLYSLARFFSYLSFSSILHCNSHLAIKTTAGQVFALCLPLPCCSVFYASAYWRRKIIFLRTNAVRKTEIAGIHALVGIFTNPRGAAAILQ